MSRILMLLLACLALPGCAWLFGRDTPRENPADIVPVSGVARFSVIDYAVKNGIARFGDRDAVMYWDERTQFMRAGMPLATAGTTIRPEINEPFEFRGVKAHDEINLKQVNFLPR